MNISLSSPNAKEAQTEAMDRILENHLLYCTVCDNNNGNCKIHNTVDMMEIEHQKYPYEPKCTQDSVDFTHPFYRYDPNQCIACGQCVEVCQNLQVNETYRSTGKRIVQLFFGMAVQKLMIHPVSAVAIVLQSVHVMH